MNKPTTKLAVIITLVMLFSQHVCAAEKVKNNVPNRSFYKDVFFDCGVGLTSRDSLPAVQMLGWSIERCAFDGADEAPMQNAIIAGDSTDWNGHLLFPDGEPRFKVFFMDGGSSLQHGSSLGEAGRRRIREFVNAGGSYVGTCAGAIIASRGFESNPSIPSYLGVWPGIYCHTGRANTSSGMFVDKKSPLLRYYNFGNDNYIENVRHNQGNYPADLPQGAEVLTRYDFKEAGRVHKQPAVAAYKANINTGRLVLCGSHPEEVVDGERRDLTAAMLQYAVDGVGVTRIKGFLENGKPRVMDRNTYERVPEYTRIGDMQYHHFAVDIPEGARDITFSLEGAPGSHMTLAIGRETFAYDDCADFRSTIDGAKHQFTLSKMAKGVWYIAVKCLDQVETVENHHGQSYRPTTVKDLLNGVPYTVTVSWR